MNFATYIVNEMRANYVGKKSGVNGEISIFFENGKQGVQTARLDELNNIVTWTKTSFIFQS